MLNDQLLEIWDSLRARNLADIRALQIRPILHQHANNFRDRYLFTFGEALPSAGELIGALHGVCHICNIPCTQYIVNGREMG